jgi:hypothetical protein
MESSEHGGNVEGTILLRLRDLLNHSPLARRQIAVLAIPTTYIGLTSDPQPGTVVGIVLGSVAGFLLLIWVIYTCFGVAIPFPGWGNRVVVEEEVIRRRSTSHRHRSSSPRETVVLEEL